MNNQDDLPTRLMSPSMKSKKIKEQARVTLLNGKGKNIRSA
jgi:hypothetical protein